MKDFYCYILLSETLNKFYTGACQDTLIDRISKHNTGYYSGQNFTKAANDWILFLKIDAVDYPHAIRIERKIKSMKSSNYIKNLLKYPELIEKIKRV